MTTTETSPDTTTDTTTEQVIDAYFAMWNEHDPAARAALIEQAWSSDGSYRDPLLAADGPTALSEMVAVVHQHYPGQRFARVTAIDEHNGFARFGWQLADDGGSVSVAGLDVAELADDGRLARITGFFGELT